MVHFSLLELDCPIFPFISLHECKTAAWALFKTFSANPTRKNCYFWVNCSFNFWSVLAGIGYNTHSVAQIFRLENMAWPACIRRDRDHVSGPFSVFVLFFPEPIVSIPVSAGLWGSVHVWNELKAVCAFDAIVAPIRSLKRCSRGCAMLYLG